VEAEAGFGIARILIRVTLQKVVRSLTDCLIAAVALRGNMSVLAHDRAFATIGELTGLVLEG
jgi:predicted nucleic acid-binding protein